MHNRFLACVSKPGAMSVWLECKFESWCVDMSRSVCWCMYMCAVSFRKECAASAHVYVGTVPMCIHVYAYVRVYMCVCMCADVNQRYGQRHHGL